MLDLLHTLKELEARRVSVIAMSGLAFDLTPHGRMLATGAGAGLSAMGAPQQDDRRAGEAHGGADHVPAVRPGTLHRPEPKEQGGDVDATLGGIGPVRELGVDPRERPREKD